MSDDEYQNNDLGEMDFIDDEEILETTELTDDSIRKLIGHNKDVFSISLSGSKKWLASGSEDDTALLWDLDQNESEPYLKVTSHSDSVTCTCFNSSNTILATGDMSGKIICTFIEAKSTQLTIEECEQLEWIQWHPSTDILFAGSGDGSIWMWLISKGATSVAQTKIFTNESNASCVLGRLLGDAKHLLAVYADGAVRIWNLKDAISILIQLVSPCSAVDIHKSLNVAAVGCHDGTTALINTQNSKHVSTFGEKTEEVEDLDPARNSVEAVRFAEEFPWLAVGTSSGFLRIYDFETGAIRHECDHDEMAVVNCIWMVDPDSVRIISTCMDSGVRIWDAKTGEPITMFLGSGDEIYDSCLVEKNDRVLLFTACANGIIRVFDLLANKQA